MKRFISAVVAAMIAVLALNVPAFAAKLKNDAEFVLNGSTTAAKVDVMVPTKAGFIINPYKLNIRVHKNGDAETSDVIGIYASGINSGSDDVDENAWKIINNSADTPVIGMMYVTYRASNRLQVNANGSDVDNSKRQLTLSLKVGSTNVPLLRTAPSGWDSSDVATFRLEKNTGSGDANKTDLVISGSTGSGDTAWTDSDYCTLTMAFKFYPVAN